MGAEFNSSKRPHLRLPPLFNKPKSQLQCFSEEVYATASDLLSRCNNGRTPIERFISVVAWTISTRRPLTFGVAPYNPILGETHHVSSGNLNLLAEAISHHPPVGALHATNEKEKIEIIWCIYGVGKFNGATVEGKVHGKRQLKLQNHGETYEMNAPSLMIRFLPVPSSDWAGNVVIRCPESGLEAELCYGGQTLLGFRGSRRSAIKGKIIDSTSRKILYEVNGHWDSTVTVKNTNNGEVKVIYDAKEVISGLQTPIVKDPKSVWASESAVVWGEVSEAILNKDWEKATAAKKLVEERQRELARERIKKGETWLPKHFAVSYTKERGWNCLPIQKSVPPAPIQTTL
ncbi:hypothetical protein PIB30_022467 [Stylosanthes scabra]|uniref:Uncharacterized protein n=1 Tax=Stylosanthes scabra TaxID=79078 RepID=A0ABU6S9D9_9FABA|nr:hypothetical protein [Stylosanthes scabra]